MSLEISIFLLVVMLFCHIIDDYYLQGILAQMKQRSFWENQPELYQNDYLMALFEHAFSWSFMIAAPLVIFHFITGFGDLRVLITFYIINMCIHARVDDLKANKKTINLIQDQYCHFIQIFITWLALLLMDGRCYKAYFKFKLITPLFDNGVILGYNKYVKRDKYTLVRKFSKFYNLIERKNGSFHLVKILFLWR